MSTGQISVIVAIIVAAFTIALSILKVAFRAGEVVNRLDVLTEMYVDMREDVDELKERSYGNAVRNPQRRR